MKRNILYNAVWLGCLAIMAGCSSDIDIPEDPSTDDAYIRIASGVNGPASRAVNTEPTYPGQCNADHLTIYSFKSSKINANDVSVSNLTYDEKFETDVDHFSGSPYPYDPLYPSDKWARKDAVITRNKDHCTGFAFPAIAFAKSEQELFSVNTSTGVIYKDISLSIIGDKTPELFFGRLQLQTQDIAKDESESNGMYVYKYSASNKKENVHFKGILYRIVSQINVTVTDVNPETVTKMTMELSNLPTNIGLYATHRSKLGETGSDHGYHYPITAAKENQHKNETVTVCETTNFRKGIAKLSTFLLPSDKGRSLNIRIYYKDGTNKSYEVRPPKSYYIPAEMSEVYFSSTPLCVYDMTANEFYSFANVRVNINGAFENFFADRFDADMDIEICPRYDRDHNYDDIDYN